MREQTIAMYCFLDDLLTRTRPVWARPADQRRGPSLHGAALGHEIAG